MTPDQLRRAMALTSIFENANTTLQYGYCENIRDGRGYTFGFCGFTTATDDASAVVEQYMSLKPVDNLLAQYLPTLENLAKTGSSNIGDLTGFCDVVESLGDDPDFRAAQDAIQRKWYYEPAMTWAKGAGLSWGLSKGQVYDAMINHGEGADDPFSIDTIFKNTLANVGGDPGTGIDEGVWLDGFLDARQKILVHDGGSDAARRVIFYRNLLDDGDIQLDGPIYIEKEIQADGWTVTDVYYGTFQIASEQPGHQQMIIT